MDYTERQSAETEKRQKYTQIRFLRLEIENRGKQPQSTTNSSWVIRGVWLKCKRGASHDQWEYVCISTMFGCLQVMHLFAIGHSHCHAPFCQLAWTQTPLHTHAWPPCQISAPLDENCVRQSVENFWGPSNQQRDRQTDRVTDRQKDRESDRATCRAAGRHFKCESECKTIDFKSGYPEQLHQMFLSSHHLPKRWREFTHNWTIKEETDERFDPSICPSIRPSIQFNTFPVTIMTGSALLLLWKFDWSILICGLAKSEF